VWGAVVVDFKPVERASDAFQQSVSGGQIAAMADRVGMEAKAATELSGGLYNNTYRVELGDGREVILRVAPELERQSRLERRLMRNEHVSLPFFAPIASMMPRTLFADWTHEIVRRDYVWQTVLDGVPASGVARDDGFYQQLGTLAKLVHGVAGERFGPVAGPHFETWGAAVINTLDSTAADLEDAGLDASDVRQVAMAAAHNVEILDEIDEPRLLHGDLWVPNLMVDEALTITGVFDHDRASWGDPAADWPIFVAGRTAKAGAFWDGYGHPEATKEARWRALIYRATHIGAVRLERHRLGRYDRIAASHEDMHAVINAIRGWSGT
jgi:aminoglycoside phosphotransferase (APT) family kinase protein